MIVGVSRTRAGLTAAVAISTLALLGCSDDEPEPKFDPPSSEAPASPSTTAASGPVAPTMPATARGTDAAAAEAFVKFYWVMVNYAQATGDLSGLASLSSKECAACRAGADSLREIFAKGGQIVGGGGDVSVIDTNFIQDSGKVDPL